MYNCIKKDRICEEIARILKLKLDSEMGNKEFSIIAFILNINAILFGCNNLLAKFSTKAKEYLIWPGSIMFVPKAGETLIWHNIVCLSSSLEICSNQHRHQHPGTLKAVASLAQLYLLISYTFLPCCCLRKQKK